MEYISSKNICLLMREALKMIDVRPMEQGARTGYIVYKMLEASELFEEFEMAELCCVAMLRDIGAYKTDDITRMMQPGFRDWMPHSIYGYLFTKYLFPVPDYGKVLLYHHMDDQQMKGVTYELEFLSGYIRLADVISKRIQEDEKFQYKSLEKGVGTKYSDKAYAMFKTAEERYHVLGKLRGTGWKDELRGLMDYIMFRNEEKKKYLEMIMYCMGFKSDILMLSTVNSICISEEIGKRLKLSDEKLEILYYGALVHNVGMLRLPKELIEAKYPLTKEQKQKIREHIDTAEQVLRRFFNNQRIVDVAVRHHERLDGTGYPKGLKDSDMTLEDEILQVGDLVCVLSKRENATKPVITKILQKEAASGRLNSQVVGTFLANYDAIMSRADAESDKILSTYRRIQLQYERAVVKYKTLLR